MKYIVDIDETICTKQQEEHYRESRPIESRIEKINQLYDEGHEIVYWTARGMATKIDYTALTKQQLKEWNCKYTELKMNKPQYDVWIDDKAQWIFEE